MEPILLHAWSPKNGGWLQSVHRPRVDPSCGRADACMRVFVDASTAKFFFFFFLDKSRKLSKIVLVLRSASVKRFDVSRMRDFLDMFVYPLTSVIFCMLLIFKKSLGSELNSFKHFFGVRGGLSLSPGHLSHLVMVEYSSPSLTASYKTVKTLHSHVLHGVYGIT